MNVRVPDQQPSRARPAADETPVTAENIWNVHHCSADGATPSVGTRTYISTAQASPGNVIDALRSVFDHPITPRGARRTAGRHRFYLGELTGVRRCFGAAAADPQQAMPPYLRPPPRRDRGTLGATARARCPREHAPHRPSAGRSENNTTSELRLTRSPHGGAGRHPANGVGAANAWLGNGHRCMNTSPRCR